jgi:L-lysine exporter family protein LysE/ArgO
VPSFGLVVPAFLSGLIFSLSLVVAIGPQNLFVLRQAAMRRHVGTVVAICTVSDGLLIAAGVAGAGAALAGWPSLIGAVRVLGAAVIFAYGALAARRALAARHADASIALERSSRLAAVAACLAFTWLNPAVYLDTVLLLGSVAATHHDQRWSFATGAILASALWFIVLGAGARLVGPKLRDPRAARWLDGFVAAVMALTGARMLF